MNTLSLRPIPRHIEFLNDYQMSNYYWEQAYPSMQVDDLFYREQPVTPMISVTAKGISQCLEFIQACEKRGHLQHYNHRNQLSGDLKVRQAFDGKIGEIVAARTIIASVPLIRGVDLNVYDPEQKNWNSDLIARNFRFAVKTHNVDMRREWPSWVFQNEDEEVFQKRHKNTIVVFVLCDNQNPLGMNRCCRGRVMAFAWLKDLHDRRLFGNMRNEKFHMDRNGKKAVYLQALEQEGMICDLNTVLKRRV